MFLFCWKTTIFTSSITEKKLFICPFASSIGALLLGWKNCNAFMHMHESGSAFFVISILRRLKPCVCVCVCAVWMYVCRRHMHTITQQPTSPSESESKTFYAGSPHAWTWASLYLHDNIFFRALGVHSHTHTHHLCIKIFHFANKQHEQKKKKSQKTMIWLH